MIIMSIIPSAVNCGNLSDPENGRVTQTGTGFDAVATYTCNNFYGLSSYIRRVCQGDGSWTGTEPTCEGITTQEFNYLSI